LNIKNIINPLKALLEGYASFNIAGYLSTTVYLEEDEISLTEDIDFGESYINIHIEPADTGKADNMSTDHVTRQTVDFILSFAVIGTSKETALLGVYNASTGVQERDGIFDIHDKIIKCLKSDKDLSGVVDGMSFSTQPRTEIFTDKEQQNYLVHGFTSVSYYKDEMEI
jgi:hypothetical protein